MGYDVHITRREDWSDTEGPDIPEADWRSVVEGDPELRLVGAAERATPGGEILRYEDQDLAEWSGHPAEDVVWFDFWHGQVIVKNPDELTLAKMRQLARMLQARVQGDDGEFYD